MAAEGQTILGARFATSCIFTGRLNNNFCTQSIPVYILYVLLLKQRIRFAIDDDMAVIIGYLIGQGTINAVILQQVCHLLRRTNIINTYDFDFGLIALGNLKEATANSSKSIYTNFYHTICTLSSLS